MKRKIPLLDKPYPRHRPASDEEVKLWLESIAGRIHAMPVKAGPKESPPKPEKPVIPAPVKKKQATHTPEKLLDRPTAAKIRRGTQPIEATLDLHGHTSDTALAALTGFIAEAQARGLRTVLVITGKGAGEKGGTLRRMLPVWFAETALREHIIAYDSAGPKHGGSGAWYVRIKRDNGRS